MFEGDSADMCAGKFPLVSMGGRAEGLAFGLEMKRPVPFTSHWFTWIPEDTPFWKESSQSEREREERIAVISIYYILPATLGVDQQIAATMITWQPTGTVLAANSSDQQKCQIERPSRTPIGLRGNHKTTQFSTRIGTSLQCEQTNKTKQNKNHFSRTFETDVGIRESWQIHFLSDNTIWMPHPKWNTSQAGQSL